MIQQQQEEEQQQHEQNMFKLKKTIAAVVLQTMVVGETQAASQTKMLNLSK